MFKNSLTVFYGYDPLILRDLGKEAMGFVGADSYMITIDSPRNKEFLAKWSKKYKDAPLGYRYPTLSTGRAYWAVRFLAEAIKKAGTTDVDAVIKSWEGMTFETPWGQVTMRPCDHQMITPSVGGEVVAKSEFFDFPYVGPATLIPAADITIPPAETGNPRCK